MQLTQQEDVAIANVYTPKTEAPNYRRQKFRGLSTELDSKTTWVLHYPDLQKWTNHLGQKKKKKATVLVRLMTHHKKVLDVQDLQPECDT